MEHSSSWEANSLWASQKISHIVCNPEVHCSVHRSTTGPCSEHDESSPYSSHLVHRKQYAADRFLGAFAKLQKVMVGLVMSFHLCTWNISAPNGWIFMTFDVWVFSKILQENTHLIKIWQEYWVFNMKNNVRLLSYLSQFFLEWEMFQRKVVEKIKTHILCSVFLFSLPKIVPLMR
jgi:hypothetical protein